jgi:protein-S-isoprenylcysteine O-methyltransferase Ste14
VSSGARFPGAGRLRWGERQFAWRGRILAALFLALAWGRWHSDQPLAPAWLLLVAASAWFRFHAGRFIPGHSNLNRLAGKALAFAGPYRYSRHPLYLANLAGVAGLILFAHCLPLWAGALLFALACAHHQALAGTEERYLASTWGEAYLGYLRVTPRWLGWPLSPRPVAGAPAAWRAESRPTGWAQAWERQGPNLMNSAAGAFILWILALVPR